MKSGVKVLILIIRLIMQNVIFALTSFLVVTVGYGMTFVQSGHRFVGFLLPVITFVSVLVLLNKTENN